MIESFSLVSAEFPSIQIGGEEFKDQLKYIQDIVTPIIASNTKQITKITKINE